MSIRTLMLASSRRSIRLRWRTFPANEILYFGKFCSGLACFVRRAIETGAIKIQDATTLERQKKIGRMEERNFAMEIHKFIIHTVLSSCGGGTCNLNTELGSPSISQAQVQLAWSMLTVAPNQRLGASQM
jgi:hypothetical protein